jgi:hypothetical protein
MSTRDVLRLLKAEGFVGAVSYKLRYAIGMGYVPEPKRDNSWNFVFTEPDIEALRAYFRNPPRPGRRPQSPASSRAGAVA